MVNCKMGLAIDMAYVSSCRVRSSVGCMLTSNCTSFSTFGALVRKLYSQTSACLRVRVNRVVSLHITSVRFRKSGIELSLKFYCIVMTTILLTLQRCWVKTNQIYPLVLLFCRFRLHLATSKEIYRFEIGRRVSLLGTPSVARYYHLYKVWSGGCLGLLGPSNSLDGPPLLEFCLHDWLTLIDFSQILQS